MLARFTQGDLHHLKPRHFRDNPTLSHTTMSSWLHAQGGRRRSLSADRRARLSTTVSAAFTGCVHISSISLTMGRWAVVSAIGPSFETLSALRAAGLAETA